MYGILYLFYIQVSKVFIRTKAIIIAMEREGAAWWKMLMVRCHSCGGFNTICIINMQLYYPSWDKRRQDNVHKEKLMGRCCVRSSDYVPFSRPDSSLVFVRSVLVAGTCSYYTKRILLWQTYANRCQHLQDM